MPRNENSSKFSRSDAIINMTDFKLAHLRLYSQRLAGNFLETPEEAVGWFGAVQSQDYAGAKWAIAQRVPGLTSASLDELFAQGKFLRTHVMRPTWHFVLPEDIRWLQKLTAPQVKNLLAYYDRKLEVDEALLARSHAVLTRALQGGKFLTRNELGQALKEAGIEAGGQRLGHLMMHAELDALICSGPLRGKQFTYALLDERVPPASPLARDEALAELARRYFTSHGPALVQDFAWWSGLSVADARAGLEMVKSDLVSEVSAGKTYWFAHPAAPVEIPHPTLHLLPNYDEHVVAYKDHSASFDATVFKNLAPDSSALLNYITVLDGLVIGGWRRTIEKKQISITTKLLIPLNEVEQAALRSAAEDFARFMGLPVDLEIREIFQTGTETGGK